MLLPKRCAPATSNDPTQLLSSSTPPLEVSNNFSASSRNRLTVSRGIRRSRRETARFRTRPKISDSFDSQGFSCSIVRITRFSTLGHHTSGGDGPSRKIEGSHRWNRSVVTTNDSTEGRKCPNFACDSNEDPYTCKSVSIGKGRARKSSKNWVCGDRNAVSRLAILFNNPLIASDSLAPIRLAETGTDLDLFINVNARRSFLNMRRDQR